MATRSWPHRVRRFLFLTGTATAVAFTVTQMTQAGDAPSGLPAELAQLRSTFAKYEDPLLAVHDGYMSTVGCVEYADGGMGIHFINPGLIGPVPDPAKPSILLYEPDGDKLRLIGVEWFVPLATGIKERPSLFGQPFDGPMEGHHPLMPKELSHYDLHAWIFKPNPAGLFKSKNPTVSCTGKSGYALMEDPPKPVSGLHQ